MIDRLVIFGATGDLTARYLLPGIAALRAAGRLPEELRLIGAGRDDWGGDRFRKWVDAQLGRHGGGLPEDARRAVADAAGYAQADVGDAGDVAAAVAGDGPVAAYLARARPGARQLVPRSRTDGGVSGRLIRPVKKRPLRSVR